ncbi:hypothetical protein N7499_002368 [Penicillium canescens]|uniref:Integrase zinc-binding domain-containing protein n=1 Tax=Penicillium canescens TaxID=5083 RepID=A0AAD6I765_PENCN|nr:uncharacterized protein N7446_009909 [Penicillium canescens]KAJ6001769.1 hypothetical protein N7522_006996 [Penicillium canescens]KAJ6035150.1 hypothetical protein N7460_009325 [Penicillium canescens]KAJ6046808.1 hypothetical protein N7444_008062 [Penicillium canescens]KAJ6053897.1 hypothetical protein N7446_009909 [Penicillium canescens]KAJ6097994.1 hypothetical protein N7499_002368 [Penicillium canescens]
MSSFARRNEGNDAYLMNHQLAAPGSYGQQENHDFAHGSPYHFPQHSFNPYGSHFGQPYGPQSSFSPGLQNLQYSSEHSIPSMTTQDDPRVHHPPQYIPQSRYLQAPKYLPLRDPMSLSEIEIESQESRNEISKLSEPVVPALDGFPDAKEFDQLMQNYVNDLSVKKQDKALIHAKRARNIRTVLIDPKDTAVESAQFRFWVKKMFKLQAMEAGTPECRKMICHEGKPVAIREKLFKILTKAHQQCQHGGRDKTSAQVRRIYSWVPKELISRFVKICPTCQVRRGGSRLTPPNSRRSSPRLEMIPRSPKLPSPPASRRESTFGQMPIDRTQSDYFGHLHSQNAWLDSHQSVQGRSALGNGVRSFQPMGNISHSIAGTLDPYTTDLSIPPSQLTYTTGYVPTHGAPPQREF